MNIEVLPTELSEQDKFLTEVVEQRCYSSDLVRAAINEGIQRAMSKKKIEMEGQWEFLGIPSA